MRVFEGATHMNGFHRATRKDYEIVSFLLADGSPLFVTVCALTLSTKQHMGRHIMYTKITYTQLDLGGTLKQKSNPLCLEYHHGRSCKYFIDKAAHRKISEKLYL